MKIQDADKQITTKLQPSNPGLVFLTIRKYGGTRTPGDASSVSDFMGQIVLEGA